MYVLAFSLLGIFLITLWSRRDVPSFHQVTWSWLVIWTFIQYGHAGSILDNIITFATKRLLDVVVSKATKSIDLHILFEIRQGFSNHIAMRRRIYMVSSGRIYILYPNWMNPFHKPSKENRLIYKRYKFKLRIIHDVQNNLNWNSYIQFLSYLF
jgi:hypothetical protein